MTLTDSELMAQLQAGNDAVVEEISHRYGTELRLFCQRMVYDASLAEDIVQDVLLKCCRMSKQTRPSGSLRGWLYQVARNRSIDEIRRMHPKIRLSALATSRHLFERGAIPLDKKSTPAGQAMKADRAQRVQMTIESMDEPLREVVILYFFQGLSREEVAEAVGLSLAGVKARLSKATRELREHLKSFDDSSL